MGRRTLSLIVAVALIVGLLSGIVGSAGAQVFDCSDVFITFARGSGQEPNLPGREVQTFFDEIQDRIGPGVSVATRELGATAYEGNQYPAVGIGLGSVQSFLNLLDAESSLLGGTLGGEYRDSVQEGTDEAVAYLNDRAIACPDEVFVLGGYSQGAQVMGEALFGLSTAAANATVFAAMFGDPKLLVNGRGPFPGACFGNTRPWRRGNIRCYQDGGIQVDLNEAYAQFEITRDGCTIPSPDLHRAITRLIEVMKRLGIANYREIDSQIPF